MKNTKTTLAGVGAILVAVGGALRAAFDGDVEDFHQSVRADITLRRMICPDTSYFHFWPPYQLRWKSVRALPAPVAANLEARLRILFLMLPLSFGKASDGGASGCTGS